MIAPAHEGLVRAVEAVFAVKVRRQHPPAVDEFESALPWAVSCRTCALIGRAPTGTIGTAVLYRAALSFAVLHAQQHHQSPSSVIRRDYGAACQACDWTASAFTALTSQADARNHTFTSGHQTTWGRWAR